MRYLLLLFTALFFFMSCRSSNLIRPGDTLDVAFDKAMNQFENENWRDAAEAFETVVSIGRGTDVGQDAQFFLAESYFNNRQFLLSATEYERYAVFHPRSPRREQAEFKEARSYYNMSPRFRLDQTNTRRALDKLRLFTSRYPASDFIPEAGEMITELRAKLAEKNYHAAEFYMRTGRYRAAAVYFSLILDQFPESVWAEQAIADQVEAYKLYADNSIPQRQLERYERARDSYETYIQLFPRGENRERVEALYNDISREIEQRRQAESRASADS
ncbi:MAG: outer membrane protein assembly factor BamD [Balneolaceae bacterium]